MGNAGTIGSLLAANVAINISSVAIKKASKLGIPTKQRRKRKGMRIP